MLNPPHICTHSADPGIPQKLSFEQRHTLTVDICTVHLVWNPPANTALADMSHYMVFIDGNNVANKTDNIAESSITYTLILYCAPYNVSLRAVNRCGRMSDSTSNVILHPQRFLYSGVSTGPTTDVSENGSPGTESQTEKGKLIINGVSMSHPCQFVMQVLCQQ